jgi:hypothetical protein
MRLYCTYFDHRYLPKGLALVESLRRHGAPFELWVFCLDEACHRVLAQLAMPEVRLVRLAELEASAPELTGVRPTRSLIEFYFTLTPFLPRYVMAQRPDAEVVTYVDSDLYFFSSPEEIFAEVGAASIGIIEHRFRDALKRLEQWGRFNVGFLPFRADADGLRVLDWWRERCVEWCYDRLEGDRFADQKYLDRWPETFRGVHVIQHKGANVAPWNVGNYRISARGGRIFIDDAPLVFFHFHGLKRIVRGIFDPRLDQYETLPGTEIKKLIYEPYLQALDRFERIVRERLTEGSGPEGTVIRQRVEKPKGVLERVRRRGEWLRGMMGRARRGELIFYAAGRAF